MDRLTNIVRSAAAGSGTILRKKPYSNKRLQEFLRDVLALANASVDGTRHIVVGVDTAKRGALQFYDIDDTGLNGFAALAGDHIEPPLRLRYEPVNVDGKRIGVFELGDCQDRPYLMRIDFSETLRRGDGYIRVNDSTVKMGLKQLQFLFEKKFRDSVCSQDIEIGFPGEIIHKGLRVPTTDLERLPSAVAGNKLKQLIEIRRNASNSGSTSRMARLMHARLYGSDDPYIKRSPDELMQELELIPGRYRDDDRRHLFEQEAQELQIVACNQGDEPIRDAALSIAMPNHEAFFVAEYLPGVRSGYPSVSIRDRSIHVTSEIGDIDSGAPSPLFRLPLRLCAGSELRGYRFSVRYSLFGQNLRAPVKGKLRLEFA
ncbi:MAG: ATP-binding protein [Woeseiaceae bacterium]|nr:ATP-binding protein [Woeseiaceae bacterium]